MNNSKLIRATHEGVLPIGDVTLNVAVLEDGTRIITQSAVFKAFGRTKRGRALNETRVPNMPAFIDANNLQPFIDNELRGVLNVISYEDKNRKESFGYNALILPKLCKVYLDGRESKALKTQQLPLARASEILLLGLSNIGIIALVDEATGYQYDRERDELQKILKAYISEELLKWQKRFPDVFYKEVFRLNGWDYTIQSIKQRPKIVGKWTNRVIYDQLPKGVLDELKLKTPKSVTGNYLARFHQSLTEDIGHPHLQAQINSVIAIMQISDNWKQFISNFNKMVDRRKGQLELKFEDLEPVDDAQQPVPQSSFDAQLTGLLGVPPPTK